VNSWLALVQAVFSDPQVKILGAAILLNAVLAVALAIVGNSFSWPKLVDFARKQVIPYILVWAVLRAFDQFAGSSIDLAGIGNIGVLSSTFFATVLATLVAKAVGNIQELLNPGSGSQGNPPEAKS
jgi:hypothetical protein